MNNHTILEDENIQFIGCVDLSTFTNYIILDKETLKIKELELKLKKK
jgi:hypothetical protein